MTRWSWGAPSTQDTGSTRRKTSSIDAAPILEATNAREHRVFAGKIDRDRLAFGEKAIVVALRAPEGDFRDWEAIRGWARSIADEARSLSRGAAVS
jgi:menaquinone-dependent protoporphyrinogen oxidase